MLSYLQEVRPSAMLFMTAVIVLILLFFVRYRTEMLPRRGTLEWIRNYEKPSFSLDGKRYPMARKDALPLLLIVIVYAIVGFTNLGSTTDPQSFFTFSEETDRVTIDLGADTDIGSMMYYTGLYPGDYELYLSSNGIDWTRIVDSTAVADENGYVNDSGMHQSYADLFKWQYSGDFGGTITCRYIQIIARSMPMELGEIALYDPDGNLIDVSGVDSVLLDEQDTIPESPTWYNSMYFDEVYHGRTAYEFLHNVYPYEITHPPLGKLIIAFGVSIFGMTPFGYRFMGCFFGVLMLIPLYVLLKNMFGKSKVAACGTLLFAFEFMHYTQTRIATIDTYSVFFVLTSFLFMWRWISQPYALRLNKTWKDLALSGLSFGIGCACKWTVIYAGLGLAFLWLLRVIMKYRAKGLAGYSGEFVRTVLLSCVFFVFVPLVIYCLSYIPYGLSTGLTFPGMLFSVDYYKLIWSNQVYMLSYHSSVHAYHPYSSSWYQWLFDIRPILYYLEYRGETKLSFGCFNSPLISWAGLIAIIAMIPAFYKRRKPQAILIWAGYGCQFLPWVGITRTTFAYHYFGASLFLVLAIAYIFDELVERRSSNRYLIYGFTGLNTALFAVFYPVLSGMETSISYCLNYLKWLPSWPWG